jgi:hypothetical protein
VIWLDPAIYARRAAELDGTIDEPTFAAALAGRRTAARNMRHQVAEFDIRTHAVPPGVPLSEVLVG